MEEFLVKVLSVTPVTHDVNAYRVEKPEGYTFTPGQATELSIWKEGWKDEKRPFTFTSLPQSDTLEFTIKSYADHSGVTAALSQITPGELLEIGPSWGAIQYNGTGTFFAGGAGITPFLAIFRDLHQRRKIDGNRLFFANKLSADIILREELQAILGNNFVNILSRENTVPHGHGRIDKRFLEENIKDFSQHFYVCGPDSFTNDLLKALQELGAKPEILVFET